MSEIRRHLLSPPLSPFLPLPSSPFVSLSLPFPPFPSLSPVPLLPHFPLPSSPLLPVLCRAGISWDQVMLIFLVHKDTICTLAAHECLGRSQARYHLENLLEDFRAHERGGVLSFSAHQRLERKLQAVVSANKGAVPPRVVLYLYPGAPKKFLTKEDQEPEYIKPEGKTRLQKALEEFDEDDDFVFSTEHKEAMAAAAAAAAGAGREGGGGGGKRGGLPPLAGKGRKGGGSGAGGAGGGKAAPPVSVSQRFSRELWRLKNPTDAWHGAYPYLSEALTPAVPDPKSSKQQKTKRGASALAVAAASAKAAKGRRLSSSSDPGLNDPPSPRFGWGGGGISDGSLWLSGLQGRMSPSLSMDFSQMGAPEGPGSVLQAGLNLMFDASIGITSEYAAMRSRSTWSVQLTRVSAESSNNWEVGFGELKRCAAAGGVVGIAVVGSKGEGSKGEGGKGERGERPGSRGGKGEGRSSKSSSAKESARDGSTRESSTTSTSSSSTRKSGAMTGIVSRKKDGTHSVMIARGGSGSAVDLKSRKHDIGGAKGGEGAEAGSQEGAEPQKEGEAAKEGGERKGREKIKGHIQARAPSGLSWEDEIASQLAAVGVRVAPSKTGEESSSSGDDDDKKSKDGRKSGIDQSPRAASAVYGSQAGSMGARKPKGPTTSVFERKRPEYTRSPSDLHGDHGRASSGGSVGRASGLAGLGRLARGLKKTFNIQGDQHAS
ncbi:unnamed protein product [Closterium sp. NIES-64]|nr:unnamed protein product [Closterium sp. NIES-64]